MIHVVIALGVALAGAPPEAAGGAPITQEPMPVSAGEDCTLAAECSPGLTCVDRVCRAFCESPADCASRSCVTVNEALKVCGDAASASLKKSQDSWSKAGWQKLRFGMGPGDVLAAAAGISCAAVTGAGDEECECEQWPEKVAGVEPSVTLKYFNGELYEVTVHLASPPSEVEAAASKKLKERWRENFRAAIVSKYGAPSAEKGVLKTKRGLALTDFYFASWAKATYSITLGLARDSGLITYTDSARIGRAAEAAARAFEEKAKVDPAGL